MKLFKYELKKNILRLPVLLLFAALILVSLYKHNETVQLYGTQDSDLQHSSTHSHQSPPEE